jgi:hypothetical protein
LLFSAILLLLYFAKYSKTVEPFSLIYIDKKFNF